MRSSNPVLTKPQAFQRAQAPGQAGQDQYGYQPQYGQPQYGQPGYPPNGQNLSPVGAVMTIDDVITKSAITMGTLFVVAAATFALLGRYGTFALLGGTLAVTGIVGFITVMVVSLRRKISPAAVLVYAVIEGMFIGAFSRLFEMLYPGIVVQAIMGTFVAAGATLAAYKYLRIKVTSQFRKIVTLSTFGLAGMFLVNMVLSLFHVNTGLVGYGSNAGMLSILISGVCVVLAVANLIMDFDYIEAGIRNGAPASESWRGAFGLTVTMVWLYTELLRIASYFRN